ncbi:response regulator [Clostridiaceae bacterium HSG29]|nr:response regulator [Clostridiaceae bacterium HSG29]
MKHKILIVEDEINLQKNLVFILKKEGYDVDAAEDGRIALSMMIENQYDLILCDVRLPHIDGLELLKNKDDLEYRTNFIMMTAYGTIESAIEAMKLGADEYITKPFRNSDVIRIISRLLHIQKLEFRNNKFKEEIQKKYELKKRIIGSSTLYTYAKSF